MNKKQEILDCIKTLNLTQEQANRLADVLASGGEGGSNKSVKFFSEIEDDLITFKVNDKEIPFTKGNEGGIGEVCLINEQDFNYIKNSIKGCGELHMERLDAGVSSNTIIGINVLYMFAENIMECYTIAAPALESGLDSVFILCKYDSKCYFRLLA